MRPLVIDEIAQAKVREILVFAADNWYRPGVSEQVPGNDSRHVAILNTYRCVFSYTDMKDELFRHLSISVPSKDYPNPIVTWVIADLFGFSGWDGKSPDPPKDWLFDVNEGEHCIVLAQKMPRSSRK